MLRRSYRGPRYRARGGQKPGGGHCLSPSLPDLDMPGDFHISLAQPMIKNRPKSKSLQTGFDPRRKKQCHAPRISMPLKQRPTTFLPGFASLNRAGRQGGEGCLDPFVALLPGSARIARLATRRPFKPRSWCKVPFQMADSFKSDDAREVEPCPSVYRRGGLPWRRVRETRGLVYRESHCRVFVSLVPTVSRGACPLLAALPIVCP